MNGCHRWIFWDYGLAGYGHNPATIATPIPYTGTTWTMITFVKTGTTGKWYVNGQFDSTHSSPSDIRYKNYHSMVGRDARMKNYGWNYFQGQLAMVQWWDTAYSASQVSSLYTVCRPPSTYWTSWLLHDCMSVTCCQCAYICSRIMTQPSIHYSREICMVWWFSQAASDERAPLQRISNAYNDCSCMRDWLVMTR